MIPYADSLGTCRTLNASGGVQSAWQAGAASRTLSTDAKLDKILKDIQEMQANQAEEQRMKLEAVLLELDASEKRQTASINAVISKLDASITASEERQAASLNDAVVKLEASVEACDTKFTSSTSENKEKLDGIAVKLHTAEMKVLRKEQAMDAVFTGLFWLMFLVFTARSIF